jgi:hypothetical protein
MIGVSSVVVSVLPTGVTTCTSNEQPEINKTMIERGKNNFCMPLLSSIVL